MADKSTPPPAAPGLWLLLGYVALVGLLFLAYRRHAPGDARRVVLTREHLQARQEAEAVLRGGPVPPEERRAFVAGAVEDAVLLREAELRHLDRNDPLIRRALLGSIARELAGDLAQPTESEARAFYDANPERYRASAAISIEQAVYAAGAKCPAAEDVLARLRAGAAPEVHGMVYGVSPRARGLTLADLVLYFGRAYADAVSAIADDDWHGPIASTLGTHFVRVTDRSPPAPRSYDDVRSYVRDDLYQDRMWSVVARHLLHLRERYDVRIEGEPR